MNNNRRKFLSQSAALALGMTAMPAFAENLRKKIAASDQLNVGAGPICRHCSHNPAPGASPFVMWTKMF
jgi:anaerobic selenocysteine-containing dehydrogenase